MWHTIFILAFNSVAGCLGNSIVIMVYSNKRSNNSSDTFIFILACLDFTVSVVYMPVSIYELLTDSSATAVCAIDKGGSFCYVTTSFALLLCIASDRLVAVRKPYEYKTIMTKTRAQLLSLACILGGFACSVPIVKSCFTTQTSDDRKHLQNFMKAYSAAVICLTLFLTG